VVVWLTPAAVVLVRDTEVLAGAMVVSVVVLVSVLVSVVAPSPTKQAKPTTRIDPCAKSISPLPQSQRTLQPRSGCLKLELMALDLFKWRMNHLLESAPRERRTQNEKQMMILQPPSLPTYFLDRDEELTYCPFFRGNQI
jgi:hypothetical protein